MIGRKNLGRPVALLRRIYCVSVLQFMTRFAFSDMTGTSYGWMRLVLSVRARFLRIERVRSVLVFMLLLRNLYWLGFPCVVRCTVVSVL